MQPSEAKKTHPVAIALEPADSDRPSGDAPVLDERADHAVPRPARRARYRLIWIALGLVGLASLSFIHLTSGEHHLLSFHRNADKLEHVFAFGAVMVWFGQLYRRGMERCLICICLIMAGVVLEFVQHRLGHFGGVEYGDMAADGVGAFLGWVMLRTPLGDVIARMDSWLARRFG
jgi:hypothetical protein